MYGLVVRGCQESFGMHFASSYTRGVWATRADARRQLPVHMDFHGAHLKKMLSH